MDFFLVNYFKTTSEISVQIQNEFSQILMVQIYGTKLLTEWFSRCFSSVSKQEH